MTQQDNTAALALGGGFVLAMVAGGRLCGPSSFGVVAGYLAM
ncbi:hypothetical protein [Arthrobacter sp.]|nr:hypothetical protein [Arthrobacter sp.]